MNNLRKVLLGGAALAVMATGAQADELSALKAQLEALQSQVNTMEASASSYNLPAGSSFITGRRGAAEYDFKARSAKDAQDWAGAENSGYTIAITPTADMPAPVAEITVSGYVYTWMVYGIDGYVDTDDARFDPLKWTGTDNHLHVNSRGAVRVRSKTDTSIGQVRTDIVMRADPSDAAVSMLYAWSEWDMTPNWTLGAGSLAETAELANYPSTVSVMLNGVGNSNRTSQVRLTYTDGPLQWAIALEQPTTESATAMPNIASHATYDMPGGHNLNVAAKIADLSDYNANDDLGWMFGGGVGINLADVATLSVSANYARGAGSDTNTDINFAHQNISNYGTCGTTGVDANNDLCETWGITAGVGFAVNDVTSVNIFGAYEENLSAISSTGEKYADAWVVGANIFWKPVKQMHMGWEVVYGEADAVAGASASSTALSDTEALNFLFQTKFFF